MNGLLEIHIESGADIKEGILAFLAEHKITNAIVLGAVGSAKDVVIAAPVENELPLRTTEVKYPIACEVVGFTGEIMEWEKADPRIKEIYPDKDDPLFVHIHIGAAISGGQMFGGGFRGGKAFRSMRIFLTRCK
jgi:predicted DNA-binding protein with PD1-like motif